MNITAIAITFMICTSLVIICLFSDDKKDEQK